MFSPIKRYNFQSKPWHVTRILQCIVHRNKRAESTSHTIPSHPNKTAESVSSRRAQLKSEKLHSWLPPLLSPSIASPLHSSKCTTLLQHIVLHSVLLPSCYSRHCATVHCIEYFCRPSQHTALHNLFCCSEVVVLHWEESSSCSITSIPGIIGWKQRHPLPPPPPPPPHSQTSTSLNF